MKKKYKHWMSLGLLVLLCVLAVGSFDSDESDKKSIKPKTSQETRKERIEGQFSAWDGSHTNLKRVIKASMNDPKSFKHVKTEYSDKGDHLVVKTTFRGKNAFGGVVINWVIAKVDLSGNVIEIIEQGP